ncbi:ER membrane protein complex subunit 2-B-like [Centruroides vittatus]|uniref:ER membrane protein complex subunit 2-B-like n=1 Tax=Centruroides vittatus TaxID=120091 RepID=UPI00350F3385
MASAMKWEDARNKLRQWRDENVRSSEEVVDIWKDCLSKYINKMGDEKWLVYEQVCIAALDIHALDVVQECLQALDHQFPGSLRIRKLKAMRLETLDKPEDAIKVYDSILQHDESNSVIHKRKIAVLKAQNQIPEAIKELSDYLKKFMSDHEGWMELCDLYLLEQDYSKAAFCMEELILSNPHNHLYHQRYAEIQYTIGGFENIELARAYFSQALKLNPHSTRALFGLFLAATSIVSSPKCIAQKKRENVKYATWAAQKITKKYQESLCEDYQLKSLEGLLSSLQISVN